MKSIMLPYKDGALEAVEAGEGVELSGTLYVGRDQVHKRLCGLIEAGSPLPFDFHGNGIYYMGPSPAPPGFPLGAAGPTTSMRMDPFSPLLIENGLRLMIGKGPRSEEVRMAIGRHKGLYLQAYGGCGALYSSCVRKAEVIAYPELGPEALLRLEIENFPAFCMIDSKGNLYNG